MKSVLVVIDTLDVGGAETLWVNILKKKYKEQYRFYFIVYKRKKKYAYEEILKNLGATIIKVPNVRNIFEFANTVRSIIKDYKIDIIHSNTYISGALSLFIGAMCHIHKRIMHAHTDDPTSMSSFDTVSGTWFFAKIVLQMFTTDRLAVSHNAGVSVFGKKDFEILPNGINYDDFKFSVASRKNIRKKHKTTEKTKIILHVGRFDKNKNQQFVIDVFEEYKKIKKDSKLFLIGRTGSEKTTVRNRIGNSAYKKDILLLDDIMNDKMPEYYSAADCLVFPSGFEGLSVTLIEAQVNGLHCLINKGIKSPDIQEDLVFYEDVNDGATSWAQTIKKMPIIHPNKIRNTTYDITNTVEQINKAYIRD